MRARRRRRVEDTANAITMFLGCVRCRAPLWRAALRAIFAVLCAALAAVLLVLGLDGRSRRLPLGVGPVPQLVKVAAGRQMLPAVHGDGLTREPRAAVRQQKGREILQLFDAPDPPHGIDPRGARAGDFVGIEALAHT